MEIKEAAEDTELETVPVFITKMEPPDVLHCWFTAMTLTLYEELQFSVCSLHCCAVVLQVFIGPSGPAATTR